MVVQHITLAAGRWQELSLKEQLGNIGSEVGRAIKAKSAEDKEMAARRALELLDLTLSDKRWYNRGNELARAREVTADFLFGNNNYSATADSLERYFMQFAISARLNC